MEEKASAVPTVVFVDRAPGRPLLIAIQATALLSALMIFASLISPGPQWRWLPFTTFFAALEGIYTTHWLSHPDRRYLSRPRYRAAEFLVIALFLRLLTWMLAGGLPGPALLRGYLLAPLSIMDGTYFVYLLVTALAWERAITWSTFFRGLALSQAEIDYYSLPRLEQVRRHPDRPIDLSRTEVFAGFVKSWLNGGIWLALGTVFTSVGFSQGQSRGFAGLTRLGLHPYMLVALLVYFLLGLWLVSQARLLMMRSRWTAEGVATTENMARTWSRATLLLILTVAGIASLLPLGRTFAIAALLEFILTFGLAVMQLFFYLLGGLLFLLLSLLGLGREPPAESEVTPAPAPEMAPLLFPEEPVGETAALVLGSLFWLVVAVIVVVAFIFFLRDRGYRLESATLRRWWNGFARLLRSLWQSGTTQTGRLRAAIAARLQAEEEKEIDAEGRSWRFLRVNALPPREQIRYFYLSTVRRAGEQGVERAQSETPSEYAQDLKATWPEADVEIEALTTAFLEARYSRRAITRNDIHPVKRVWKRVRHLLRRRGAGH